jgi:anti-sigma factor RsiW
MTLSTIPTEEITAELARRRQAADSAMRWQIEAHRGAIAILEKRIAAILGSDATPQVPPQAHRKPSARPVKAEHVARVLNVLREAYTTLTARVIESRTGLTPGIVRNALAELLAANEIFASGGRKCRRYYVGVPF